MDKNERYARGRSLLLNLNGLVSIALRNKYYGQKYREIVDGALRGDLDDSYKTCKEKIGEEKLGERARLFYSGFEKIILFMKGELENPARLPLQEIKRGDSFKEVLLKWYDTFTPTVVQTTQTPVEVVQTAPKTLKDYFTYQGKLDNLVLIGELGNSELTRASLSQDAYLLSQAIGHKIGNIDDVPEWRIVCPTYPAQLQAAGIIHKELKLETTVRGKVNLNSDSSDERKDNEKTEYLDHLLNSRDGSWIVVVPEMNKRLFFNYIMDSCYEPRPRLKEIEGSGAVHFDFRAPLAIEEILKVRIMNMWLKEE